MLKMKKRSLLVVFAFAMVLALSCSAFAATTIDTDQTARVSATGGAEVILDDININVTGSNETGYGIYSYGSGSSVTGTAAVTTDGSKAHGANAHTSALIKLTGSVQTASNDSHAVRAYG